MRRFFDQHTTRWRKLTGALHLYVCPPPDDHLFDTFRREAAALTPFHQLAIQPERFVHMTLQRLDAYREELEPHDLARLGASLGDELGELESFQVTYAGATVRERAVEAIGQPSDQWADLVWHIQRAVDVAGLGHTLAEPPFGPHYTLAYCVEDVLDSDIETRLAAVATSTTMAVDKVTLVAVDQHPDKGIFTFDTLAQWPLRSTVARQPKAGVPWSAGPG